MSRFLRHVHQTVKEVAQPQGDSTILVPYTYYRLCGSYREADGNVRQRTVLGLGELTDFPKESQKRELAEQGEG